MNAAERGGWLHQRATVDEVFSAFFGRQFQADQKTEAFHLNPREVVRGIVFQSRKAHEVDCRVLL